MGLRLPGFPVLPQHTMTIILDDTEYRVRFTYRARLGAWYFDLFTLDDTALALGRRVSPGWGPLLGVSVPDGPTSLIVVVGEDIYSQLDLADSLVLVAWTVAELAAFDTRVVADPVAVVIA